jgi:predicted dinucleotide-binding enzyme
MHEHNQRMKIAIIGGGRLGRALVQRFSHRGYDVILASRSSGDSYADASDGAHFIFLATTWEHTLSAVAELRLAANAILIDCTNPEAGAGPGLIAGMSGSGCEEIAWASA